MENSKTTVLHRALERILRPLCRILLKYSISTADFTEQFKRIYVETARESLGKRGRVANKSAIAAATGINRKEVTRLCGVLDQAKIGSLVEQQHNRSIHLIHHWKTNSNFLDQQGQPAPLPLEGDNSFTALTKQLGQDVPVTALLKEYQRTGIVSIDEQGKIRLQSQGFIPSDDEINKLLLLGTDVSLLINTIEHNLLLEESGDAPLYQRKVAFNGLSQKGLQKIEDIVHKEGQEILEKLDRELPDYYTDNKDKPSHYAGVGIYIFRKKS